MIEFDRKLFHHLYGQQRKWHRLADPSIEGASTPKGKLMAQDKRKTRAEERAEQDAAAKEADTLRAMQNLEVLKSAYTQLAVQPGRRLNHAVKAIQQEIDFLLRDSEIYRDAAARLYAGQSTHGAETGNRIVGNGPIFPIRDFSDD